MSLTDADKVWFENENARLLRQIKALLDARPASAAGASAGGAKGPKAPPGTFPYGRQKGNPIRGASIEDLHFYLDRELPRLTDDTLEQWQKDKAAIVVAAYREEIARQHSGAAPGDDDVKF